jgi:flagellar hook-basal body complex protein FliE
MLDSVAPTVSSVGTALGLEAPSTAAPLRTGAASSAAETHTDFAAILSEFAGNAIDTIKSGEAAAISGAQGKASVQQVVESVMSAEQTLQAAIAIRDKAVAAYLELSRMAI